MNPWHTMMRLDLPHFVESVMATEAAEDWSRVRSPSRARRRLARGKPQNIRHYRKPACYFSKPDNCYFIHPDVAKALREQASEKIDRTIMREMSAPLYRPFYTPFSFVSGV